MGDWQEWQIVYRFGTIVIWPPDTIREIINDQRAAYDPISHSYCEAHITVTQPFLNPPSDHDWDRVLNVIKNHQPFEIHYGPLNSFLPYPCIWYEIEPRDKILDLRRDLHKIGCFNLDLSHTDDFKPHMTITEGQSGPDVNYDLLDEISRVSSTGSFHCEELAYIVPNERFRFEVAKTIPLTFTESR